MRRPILSLCCAALLSITVIPAFAGAPPAIPANQLRPAVPAGPNPAYVPPDPFAGIPVAPYTLSTLKGSHLSGVVYHNILTRLTAKTTTGALRPSARGIRGGTSFAVNPDATVQSPSINATADSPQDVEPSTVTLTASGVDRTVTSYIQYEGGTTPRIHYASTTDFSTFQHGAMPVPGGYSFTGDPFMDENPYAGGVAGYRTYCAGMAFNSGEQNAPNAIAVWHSDPSDNGSWTASPTIADNRGAGYFLDKPALAVSWHNSTDLGYVYLAYVSYDYVNLNTAIVVARSVDGGATFPLKTVVAYGQAPATNHGVANPQIVVAPGSGAVYVIWLDFGANQIQMARSTDFAATFGAHEVAANTTLTTGNLTGGIRAETVPMARYNSVTNSILLVWHDTTANGTNVEYAYKDINGWHNPASPVQFTANDQFMPAVDFNGAGNVIITYYDRHADPANTAYRAYEAYITTSGTRIDANDNWMGGFDSTANGNDFIGDYQGVWDWTFAIGERSTATWIGVTSSVYDNWLTRISY